MCGRGNIHLSVILLTCPLHMVSRTLHHHLLKLIPEWQGPLSFAQDVLGGSYPPCVRVCLRQRSVRCCLAMHELLHPFEKGFIQQHVELNLYKLDLYK